MKYGHIFDDIRLTDKIQYVTEALKSSSVDQNSTIVFISQSCIIFIGDRNKKMEVFSTGHLPFLVIVYHKKYTMRGHIA
jgi:hypothetical protein